MKAIRDVSLQSLFVEIEARHGKEEAEHFRKFYQGISGSYHAPAFMHSNTSRRRRKYTTKLNETQVLEIRDLASKGFSQREIAERFDVDHVTIHHILTGRTWKHVK